MSDIETTPTSSMDAFKPPKNIITTLPKMKVATARPKYSEMIIDAIMALKERGGSSRQAILKYISTTYNLGDNSTAINSRLKTALKDGVADGSLKQSNGTGAQGSFRLSDKAKKLKTKKVAEQKPKSPKKTVAKSPKKTVAKSPKKTVAKSPKKTVAKSPKKTVAKSPKKTIDKPTKKTAPNSPKTIVAQSPKKTAKSQPKKTVAKSPKKTSSKSHEKTAAKSPKKTAAKPAKKIAKSPNRAKSPQNSVDKSAKKVKSTVKRLAVPKKSKSQKRLSSVRAMTPSVKSKSAKKSTVKTSKTIKKSSATKDAYFFASIMADWQGTYTVTVGTEDQMTAVTDKLIKREEERQAQLQKRRQEESEQSFKVQESVKLFLDAFKAERLDLEEQLDKSKSVEASNLITHFDNLSQRVSKLQRYVSESAMFLPPYDLKTAQNILTSLQTKIHEKREELIPKKKFAFKSSNRKTDKRPAVSCSLKSEETAKDSNSGDDLVLELAACKFVGISNRTLQKNRNEIDKKDIALANLTDCTVLLYGSPSAIHMNKLKNCKVFSGPVPGSIFIRECVNCTFNLSCHQLRIHSTTNSHFYIHVTSKAIVEDCSDVKFAPCTWTYDGQDEDYATSGLSKDRNNWDLVDDFNWLAADAHSPNWSILKESERITNWNV
ncbi:hypothetical protein Btru_056891 [Bulinus truncatus]|nr:hypothetical protein Btru_056891 [Bulinus truncatus]